MPKIPTFQAGGPTGPKLVEPIARATGEGAALAEVGGQVGQLGQALVARKVQSDLSNLSAEVTTAQAELEVQLKEASKTADPNDTEFADRFREEVVKTRLDNLSDQAKTSEGRRFLTQARASSEAHFLKSTEASQAKLSEVAAVANFERQRDTASSNLISDPGSLSIHEDLLTQSIDARTDISAANKVVLKKDALPQLASAAILGEIDEDADDALAMLEGGDFDAKIDGQTKQRMINIARAKIKAEAQKKSKVDLIDFKQDMARTEKTGNTLQQWSDDRIASMFPDDEIRQRELRIQRDRSLVIGKEVNTVRNTAIQDDTKRLEQMEDALATAPDFTVANAELEAATFAMGAKIDALRKEPIKWLQENDLIVSDQWEKFSENPNENTLSNAVLITGAAYTDITGSSDFPILPKNIMEDVGEALSGIETGGRQGAQDAAGVLGTWKNLLGTHWPAAVRDLREGGFITPSQAIAADALGGKNPSVALLILQSGRQSAAELAKIAGRKTSVAEAEDAASIALRPLMETLEAKDIKGVFTDYHSAITNAVLFEIAKEGGGGRRRSENKIASDIAKKLVSENYTFIGGTRVPVDQNAKEVINGTRSIMRSLDALDIKPPGSRTGLLPDEAVADYRSRVEASGAWRPNSNETGLVLVDDTGRAVIETRGGVDRIVERSWTELTDVSLKSKEKAAEKLAAHKGFIQ